MTGRSKAPTPIEIVAGATAMATLSKPTRWPQTDLHAFTERKHPAMNTNTLLTTAVAAALLAFGLAQNAAGEPITEFSIPSNNTDPTGITVGPDGALWFTERSGTKLGRITTSGTITETTAVI